MCYLDEASALDQRNQRSLIELAEDFGFALIFASLAPLITAHYCIPISSRDGYNYISRTGWQILDRLDAEGAVVTPPVPKASATHHAEIFSSASGIISVETIAITMPAVACKDLFSLCLLL